MTESYRGLPMRQRIVAVVAMSIGSLTLMIDTSIAGVVLPTIAKQLNVPSAATVTVVTVYQLILAMTVLPFAALGERIGLRRLYQLGLLLHCIGGLLSFFADNLAAIVAVRSLQALGTASAISVSTALLREIYPAERLGGGLGINTIFNASGTALAPVIGGLILSIASWHWAFAAVVPLSMMSLLLSRALPVTKPRVDRFDLLGAALCALTFGLVIAGLQSAVQTTHVWWSIGVVICGAVIAYFFVRHEMKETRPVLPLDLLKMPVIALSVLSCFTATIGSIILMLFIPFRLQHGFGFHPGEIGGLMSAYAVASLMIAPTAGMLSDRIPVPLLSTIGMSIASIGLLCIAFLPAQPSHFDIAWRIWLCGAGFSMFSSPNARLIVASAPVARTASAGSIFTTTRMLSQAGGATLFAALLAFGLDESSAPAFVAMSLTMIAGAISVASLRLVKSSTAVLSK